MTLSPSSPIHERQTCAQLLEKMVRCAATCLSLCLFVALLWADLLGKVFVQGVTMEERLSCGVHVLRFSKGHSWHYIIVDDRWAAVLVPGEGGC